MRREAESDDVASDDYCGWSRGWRGVGGQNATVVARRLCRERRNWVQEGRASLRIRGKYNSPLKMLDSLLCANGRGTYHGEPCALILWM